MIRKTLLALVFVFVGAAPGPTEQLGALSFVVGAPGATGAFPAALFASGASHPVGSITEDADGWHLTYDSGVADDWSDAEDLDITVTVTYSDDVDTRIFVLGGFVASTSSRTLTLEPPVPGGRLDWADRAGETVRMGFSRVPIPVAVAPAPLTEPTTAPDSFIAWLSETTPGGPVILQALLVVFVYAGVLWRTPATPWGVITAALALVLTPWVPVFYGLGSTMAASVVGVNVAAGAYCWKVWAARTEE